MSNVITTTTEKPLETVVRPVGALESLCKFSGESLVELGTMSADESIRLGVSLVTRGEEQKARGVFVLAEKARQIPDADSLATFREGIKSEMVQQSIERVIALSKDLGPKQLETAKAQAKADAEKRYDNVNQAIRAAKWVLDNPKKVADGISVFTVSQANAYLGDVKENAEKAAVQKAILPLLAKPGTSQAAIKKAISTAKEAHAKTKIVPDNRTEEQKKEQAKTAAERSLVSKVQTIVKDWQGLIETGSKPEELRALRIDASDEKSGTIATVIQTLAQLAGFVVSQVPRPAGK